MEYNVDLRWPRAGEGEQARQEEGAERRRSTRGRKPGRRGRRGRPRKASRWDNAMMQAMETLSRLVTPEVLLPVQLRSEPEDLPEYGLLRAVLLSAVEEYADSFKPSPNLDVAHRRREARKVAESWFAGDPGAPIEFELCCAMFGMSADQMRAKIQRLTKRLSAPLN